MDDERDEDLARPHTVAALFEDAIDARGAIEAIRKADRIPDEVSLLVALPGKRDGVPVVAEAASEADLNDLAGWLHGLATAILPGRGPYLLAGPLGAAAAGLAAAAVDPATGGEASLERVIREFGFGADEAEYLAKRLLAGVPLVAVTTRPGESPSEARRLFADHDAVFIGSAETDEATVATAYDLLEARPEATAGGAVEIADAVGNLHRVRADGGPAPITALLGRAVVDRAGVELGEIDDVMVEAFDPDGRSGPLPEEQVLRYVVVGHGGLFGLRRRRVALPAALLDLDPNPAQAAIEKAAFETAPAFGDGPFSRTDEQAVNEHFGVRAYWLGEPAQSP